MKQQDTSSPQRGQTILQGGLRRPTWISRNMRQNVVLVRDKSGSMSGQKAQDASEASLDLVSELAQPINKDGFRVAVVDFSRASEIVQPLEKATLLYGQVHPLTIGPDSGSTNITAGLQDALHIIEVTESSAQDGVRYLRPVVICFTDGCHNTGPDPRSVAQQLKQHADLVTVAFGTDADEGLLRDLASTTQHCYRCANGRELRGFLAAVGATMTATMAAGTNATQALTLVQQ